MLGKSQAVTSLPAVDIERARRFYRDTLGLKPMETPVPDSAGFEAGNGSLIFLYQRGATKADHTVLTFIVDDVEAMVAALNKKGVMMQQYDMPDFGLKTDARGIVTDPTGQKVAWFLDSEGNILSIGDA